MGRHLHIPLPTPVTLRSGFLVTEKTSLTRSRDTAATVEHVRRVIERLVADGTAVARADGSVRHLFPAAIPGVEGEALREWVIREKAVHSIEIGFGYAVSTLFVCEGLLAHGAADARHLVIDPNQES